LGLSFTSRDGGNGTATIWGDLLRKSCAGTTKQQEEEEELGDSGSRDTKHKSKTSWTRVRDRYEHIFQFLKLVSLFASGFDAEIAKCFPGMCPLLGQVVAYKFDLTLYMLVIFLAGSLYKTMFWHTTDFDV